MMFKSLYNFGDIVFLKTDKDQTERMVTAFNLMPAGCQIQLSQGAATSWHYELEISIEKNVLTATTN